MGSFIDEDEKRRYEKASELILERNITIGSPREAIVELLVEMARYEESHYRDFMWQAHQEVEAIRKDTYKELVDENERLKNKNISFQVEYDILLKKYECLLDKIIKLQ